MQSSIKMVKVTPLSLQTAINNIIFIAPELSFLRFFSILIEFYAACFIFLYKTIKITVMNFLKNFTNSVNKFGSSYLLIYNSHGKDFMADVWVGCKATTIICGLIWFFHYYSPNESKQHYAYLLATSSSLVGHLTCAIYQIKHFVILFNSSRVTFDRNRIRLIHDSRIKIIDDPIPSVLRNETTFMLVTSGLILTSPGNSFKLLYVLLHSLLGLLGLIKVESGMLIKSSLGKPSWSFSRFSIKNKLLFLSTCLENIVMIRFWYEAFKYGSIERIILFTSYYLLKWEHLTTAKAIVRWIFSTFAGLHKRLTKSKKDKRLFSTVANNHHHFIPEDTLKIDFDNFSIISDLH